MTRLPNLPQASAIEVLSYEQTLAAMVQRLTDEFDAADVDYDVGNLETDPAKIQAQVSAYHEVNLRARINDAIKANLLAYAEDADLDHLAAFYDVTRLTGETDDRLAQRIGLAISGRSTAGPRERYELIALGVSTNIRRARCYRVGGTPELAVAIQTYDNGGVPSQQLLDDVTDALMDEGVRVFSDVVAAVAASAPVTTNIIASVWLSPVTPLSLVSGLEARLRSAWDDYGGFGVDLQPSWITMQLHIDGVSRVQVSSPAAMVAVGDREIAAIGSVIITFEGYAL